MADRTLIGVVTDEGFRAQYCYHGGAPDWNGIILLQHFNNPEKVGQLLDDGALSILRPTAETPPDVSWLPDDIHAAEAPLDGITRHYRYYPSDPRGEFPEFAGRNPEDFWRIRFTHGPDYYYLLTPDGWFVSCTAEPDRAPEPLAPYLVEFVTADARWELPDELHRTRRAESGYAE